jgi:DNA-binding XRE family transcriptional regulator
MARDDYRSRLIAVRKKLGLTRGEMAKRLLVPRVAYEQWEDGKKPTPSAVVRAAETIADRRMFTAKVLTLADGSLTAIQIAEKLAVHRIGVYRALAELRRDKQPLSVMPAKRGAKLHSKWRITARAVRASKRNERIAAAVRAGETYSAIGKRYCLSRERVRQIAHSFGLISHRAMAMRQGLKAERLAKKAAARAARRADLERRYARMRELVQGGMSIRRAGEAVGFTESQIQWLSGKLSLGAITQHGWRARRSREGPNSE